MSRVTRTVVCIAIAAAIMAPAAGSYATTGYFSHGYGVKYKGLAGAGSALHVSTLAAAINPGAMVFVGKRYDADVALFSPNRSYTVTGTPTGQPAFGLAPGTQESENNYFVIPALGGNWTFQEETMSVGVAVYGNGGMNTDWPTDTYFGSEPSGVDLYQLFLATTLGVKFKEKHGFGVTPIFAWQRFYAKGLEQFAAFSRYPDKLTNNGYDDSYGFGFRVGYLGKVHEMVWLAASYQSRIWMSELDEYSGLFADKGDFDIPPTWVIGIGYFPTETISVAFDVQQIRYEEVKSVHHPLLPNLMEAQLGDPDGAGFGWQNILVFKLGLELAGPETYTWRLGYSYNDQPIPDTETLFNILAPGIQQHHITGGLSKVLRDRHEASLTLMYSPSNTVTGPNQLDPAQTIELEMSQWEIVLGYSFF